MSQIEIALAFRLKDSTVSDCIFLTCQVIWDVLKERVMPTPDEAKFLEVADGFEERWNFPNVIGSIDGKHVNI